MKALTTIFTSAIFLILTLSYSNKVSASIVASITCEDSFRGFFCEATPVDSNEDTYTYFWDSTFTQPSANATCLAGPTNQTFCYEGCNHGQLSGVGVVEVTIVDNITGNSDTAAKALDCGSGGGGGF